MWQQPSVLVVGLLEEALLWAMMRMKYHARVKTTRKVRRVVKMLSLNVLGEGSEVTMIPKQRGIEILEKALMDFGTTRLVPQW
jgi:hypothetical protein